MVRCEQEPVETYANNVLSTCHVLEVIRGEQAASGRPVRVLFASSAAVYGNPRLPRAVRETDVSQPPLSLYGMQKTACEQLIRQYHRQYGIPAFVFRLFNVYGPGQKEDAGVISRFAARIRREAVLTLDGGGRQTRDFVSVHDAVRACMLGLRLPDGKCKGEAVNVASGKSISIRSLAAQMSRIAGRRLSTVNGASRRADLVDSRADVRRARRLLSWRAQIGLEEGLTEILASPARPAWAGGKTG